MGALLVILFAGRVARDARWALAAAVYLLPGLVFAVESWTHGGWTTLVYWECSPSSRGRRWRWPTEPAVSRRRGKDEGLIRTTGRPFTEAFDHGIGGLSEIAADGAPRGSIIPMRLTISVLSVAAFLLAATPAQAATAPKDPVKALRAVLQTRQGRHVHRRQRHLVEEERPRLTIHAAHRQVRLRAGKIAASDITATIHHGR